MLLSRCSESKTTITLKLDVAGLRVVNAFLLTCDIKSVAEVNIWIFKFLKNFQYAIPRRISLLVAYN